MNWVKDLVPLKITKLIKKLLRSTVMLNQRWWKLKVIQMLNIFMMKKETDIGREEETGTEIVIETGLLPGKICSETDGASGETAEKETGKEIGQGVETENVIVTEKEKEEMWRETEEIGTDKDWTLPEREPKRGIEEKGAGIEILNVIETEI